MNHRETLIISHEDAGMRLDKVLARHYCGSYSRAYFQSLIQDNQITVNGTVVKKRIASKVGDQIDICFVSPPELDLIPEDIPLNILFEDEDLLVVNKPAGMVVHPAPGNWSGTFVNALLHHTNQLPASPQKRPGIVHRLDKDTTGVMVAAKTAVALERLMNMFARREVYKEYWAICLGNPGKGEVTLPIGRHPVHRQRMAIREDGGRSATTRYATQAFHAPFSLIHIVPTTGRTHQIRVHMQHCGHPILGDALYGNMSMNQKYKIERQLLHAKRLGFKHPMTGNMMEISADLPQDMHIFVQ